jgi:hypothetical protein
MLENIMVHWRSVHPQTDYATFRPTPSFLLTSRLLWKCFTVHSQFKWGGLYVHQKNVLFFCAILSRVLKNSIFWGENWDLSTHFCILSRCDNWSAKGLNMSAAIKYSAVNTLNGQHLTWKPDGHHKCVKKMMWQIVLLLLCSSTGCT